MEEKDCHFQTCVCYSWVYCINDDAIRTNNSSALISVWKSQRMK